MHNHLALKIFGADLCRCFINMSNAEFSIILNILIFIMLMDLFFTH